MNFLWLQRATAQRPSVKRAEAFIMAHYHQTVCIIVLNGVFCIVLHFPKQPLVKKNQKTQAQKTPTNASEDPSLSSEHSGNAGFFTILRGPQKKLRTHDEFYYDFLFLEDIAVHVWTVYRQVSDIVAVIHVCIHKIITHKNHFCNEQWQLDFLFCSSYRYTKNSNTVDINRPHRMLCSRTIMLKYQN